MKFLVDASVSYKRVGHLRSLGHDALSVVEKFPPKTPDPIIFDAAIADKAVLVTRDQDFTNTVKYPPSKTQGIVFNHWGNWTAHEEIELLGPVLNGMKPDQVHGKLVTVYRSGAVAIL